MTDQDKALLAALVQREGKAQVDVDRFAAVMDIGRTLAWQMVKEGRVRVVREGRTTRVPLSEIVRLQSEAIAAAPEAAR